MVFKKKNSTKLKTKKKTQNYLHKFMKRLLKIQMIIVILKNNLSQLPLIPLVNTDVAYTSLECLLFF